MLVNLQWLWVISFMASTALLSFLIDRVLLKWIFWRKPIQTDVFYDDENVIWCYCKNIVHLSLSNRTSFYVSCRMCKCGGGRRDAIQTLSLFLKLCLAKWHFSFKSVINSCSNNYLESEHTNTWKKQQQQQHTGRDAKWQNMSILLHTWWQTQLCLTNR